MEGARDREAVTEHESAAIAGAAPAEAPHVETILRLQRNAGNAAVNRVLARQPAGTATTASPATSFNERALETALHGRDFRGAAGLLATLDDSAIRGRIASLSEDDLFGLMIGCTLLDPEPRRVSAIVVQRLHDAGQERVLADFRRALEDDRDTAAAELLSQLDRDRVPGALTGFSSQTLEDLSTALQTNHPFLTDLYRRVRFAAFGPGPDVPVHQFEVTEAGTLAHEADLAGGGRVEVRTGVGMRGGRPATRHIRRRNTYTMNYTGPQSERTHWLQFIWREIVVTHPTTGTNRLNNEIETSGGHYRLTTDPDLPNYNTDRAPTAADPFYDHSGARERTADGITMMDHPSQMDDIVQDQFAHGATHVISRAHFATYLVRDMDVLYRVNLTVQWDFPRAGDTPRTQAVDSAGPASFLDPRMRDRLIEQLPHFDYLP